MIVFTRIRAEERIEASRPDSMPGYSDLRIAIIGGGVCGITCAAALAKKGLNAHVYEAKVYPLVSLSQERAMTYIN